MLKSGGRGGGSGNLNAKGLASDQRLVFGASRGDRWGDDFQSLVPD